MEGALKPLDSLMGLSNGICKSLYGVYKGIENDLFNSRRKAVLELGAQTAIGLILDQIMVAVDTTETPPRISLNPKVRHLVGKENIDEIPKDSGYAYGVIMALVDYISGMTDHYATELCRKFLGLGY